MEKSIKRYEVFHSTQLSSKKPQILCAYCTDAMIIRKVKLHLFFPHKILSYHFVKHRSSAGYENLSTAFIICMLNANTNSPTEQRLNPHSSKHRKSWGVKSFKTVQQRLFFWFMTTEIVPALCILDATEIQSRNGRESGERTCLFWMKWITH